MNDKYYLTFASILFLSTYILIVPLWIVNLSFVFIIVFSTNKIKVPVSIILLFTASYLNSTIDINGDIGNYQYLYDNIFNNNVTYEFNSEPVIIYIFKLFNLINLDFRSVLFIQSLSFNLIMLFVSIKLLGNRGLNYFAILMIFPPYIQMGLYLYRQSLGVVIFLFAVCLQNNATKVSFFILSILSHSASLFYISLVLIKDKCSKYIDFKFLMLILLLLLFFPIKNEFITWLLSMLKGFSYEINRKVDFFLRDDISSTFSLFSTIIIPLHALYLYVLLYFFKNKNVKVNAFLFIFLMVYLFILLTRNFSFLPTRFGLIVIMLGPIFFGGVLESYKNRNYIYFHSFFVFFVMVSFVRFVIINDVGNNNISFLNNNMFYFNML
ncbi:EpsG family protein [Aliivibrio fischeri]|uniref:EpsG family protein n=1 Tax=Aliivibrio fischeri TaxID=668 RepID=UPI0012DAAB8B|nr:EpsG family protein [Aliivibrio fischeri]MUK67957.1 hypothetical protein [Aliivibrio fischeri]MUK72904.1 hypothetical protein [Aliivibrio fischeri]